MARTRYKIYENNQPYFLTCTTVNWLPIFTSIEVFDILVDSLKFLQKEKRLTVHAYVILENHIHLIASSENLAKEIGHFKSFTAHEIIALLKERNNKRLLKQLNYYKLRHKKDRAFQLWQEGSHPKLIDSDEMLDQKIDYIHYNPVKRGYVDEPEHWQYSSARSYAGEKSVLDVEILEL